MEKYPNWRCYVYTIYGDNKHTEYGFNDLREYFDITGVPVAECKKDFIGNPKESEFYCFKAGDYAHIDLTNNGCLRIRKVM